MRNFVAMSLATASTLTCASMAASSLMRDFPREFKVSELWEHLVIDGKPTRAYRFVATESLDEVKRKVSAWLKQSQGPALEHTKNGWTYFSHRKEGTWITIQVRSIEAGASSAVEGLLSFWQDSNQRSTPSLEPALSTLHKMQVIRRLENVDKGQFAITLTAISDSSVESIANGLAADLKTHGFVSASYAPPALLPSAKDKAPYGAVSRAWIGPGKQVLFSVFEHRGKTAAQIYVLGGKNIE
jgi:hypothetical protein